jgi:hypothetical protein
MKIRSLTRRSDFQKAYQTGRKLVGHYVVFYLLRGPDDARAVVASRKVGNAVARNRAKRLLREMMQAVIFEEPNRSTRITACCPSGRRAADANDDNNHGADQESCLWIVTVARRAILDCDIHAVKAESLAMIEDLIGPGD